MKNLIFVFMTAVVMAAAAMFGGDEQISYVIRWQTSSYNPATRPEVKNHLLKTATDTNAVFTGTGRDTTAVFVLPREFSFKAFPRDTSVTDSNTQKIYFYTASDNQFRKGVPAWGEFTLEDSVSVGNVTVQRWTPQDAVGAISKDRYGFLVVVGQATHKKTAATYTKVLISGVN